MLIKTLIISVILVSIIMLALSIKLIFDKDAEFVAHSCKLEDSKTDMDGGCSNCQLKEITNGSDSKG